MKYDFSSRLLLNDFSLWKRLEGKRALCYFDLEITARCNLNCRHCYINLPAADRREEAEELSLGEIKRIAGQAVSLGALWSLLTGGEPLLRRDFFDVYLALKKAGLLVSLFTNATLVTEEHVRLLKKYPPRAIEVTVYGVTPETYERITRVPGSYDVFRRGLALLTQADLPVVLKAMAMRSNLHEMPEIIRFCRENGRFFFRFDPFLHLRYDGDPLRNRDIISERLTPEQVVELEASDSPRRSYLQTNCSSLIQPEFAAETSKALFRCGVGKESFAVSSRGILRFCPSLWHPRCVFDLRQGSLADAWFGLLGKVRAMESNRAEFLEKCRRCPVINLCMWCPALGHLETGELDVPVEFFCGLAHAREKALKNQLTT